MTIQTKTVNELLDEYHIGKNRVSLGDVLRAMQEQQRQLDQLKKELKAQRGRMDETMDTHAKLCDDKFRSVITTGKTNEEK